MAVAFVVIPLQELQKGHIQPHGCEPMRNTLLTPGERKNERFFFRPKINCFFFGSWPKHPSWGLKTRKRKIRTITMTPLTLTLPSELTNPSGKKMGVIYLTSSPPKRCVGNQRLSPVFYGKFWKLTKNLIHFWAPRNEESLVFLGPLWRSVKKFHRPSWPISWYHMFQGDFLQPMNGIRAFFFEKGWKWAPELN